MLGAGLTIYADDRVVNMLEQAVNASQFFRNESCGKCVPCRVGSQKLVSLGEQITQDRRTQEELARDKSLVLELLQVLELTSICGLGMSAAKPLATVLQSFTGDIGLQTPTRPERTS
jgi:NADH:ubiquinone oxidoreductase subunit F (NADH-binding)